MEYHILKKEEQKKTYWAGGSSVQLGIFPHEKKYEERDFIWRISTAEAAEEQSEFTALPDYDRVLVVLSGEVVLVHDDERAIRLAPFEQDRFDGAWRTTCFGKMTDYNLMVRKGAFGYSEAVRPRPEKQSLSAEVHEGYGCLSRGYYCATEYAVILINGEAHLLKSGDHMTINSRVEEEVRIDIMGEGILIASYIYFNYQGIEPEEQKESRAEEAAGGAAEDGAERQENGKPPQSGAVKQEKSRITGSDIGDAYKIAFTRFRGSRRLVKSLKSVWYDKELQRGLNRIERVYLPYIIMFLGLAVFGLGAAELIGEDGAVFAVFLWLLVDITLVTPLIYLLMLPKPIREHIRPIAELTEEEQKAYEQELTENKRVDRILKKYEITGRNKYID